MGTQGVEHTRAPARCSQSRAGPGWRPTAFLVAGASGADACFTILFSGWTSFPKLQFFLLSQLMMENMCRQL